MIKTTVYLPEALKARLERLAAEQRRSEAEIIRAALEEFTARARPRPRLPLYTAGDTETNVAELAEQILAESLGRE